MLLGEFSTQLGEKNRVAIPKRLRDNLSGRIFLTRGYERCLILVDSDRWQKLLDEINTKPLLSMDVRDTKRYILGGAQEVEPDAQGRFVLSESLKEFAGIAEKITFLGVGEWTEIWSEERWLERLEDLSRNAASLAERLGN